MTTEEAKHVAVAAKSRLRHMELTARGALRSRQAWRFRALTVRNSNRCLVTRVTHKVSLLIPPPAIRLLLPNSLKSSGLVSSPAVALVQWLYCITGFPTK